MCYPDDARPPDHGRGGDVAAFRDLELTAADGNRFAAYSARAASATGAGMVVLPDVRGLHNFYRSMACRLAEGGLDAVAIDYFGRTAGTGDRSEDFDFTPHTKKTTREGIAADVAAAIDFLSSPEGGGVERVFTVGFCFGGANSWAQSALAPGLTGAIGFYGRPEAMRDLVPQMKAPVLLLVAGADQATPMSEFEDLDQRLDEAGVPHRMVVFDGAPHSFFDRAYAQFEDECRRAWDGVFAFVESPPA